jgi:hypothetical protein
MCDNCIDVLIFNKMLTNIVDFSTKKIGKILVFSSAILTNFAICWGKICQIF